MLFTEGVALFTNFVGYIKSWIKKQEIFTVFQITGLKLFLKIFLYFSVYRTPLIHHIQGRNESGTSLSLNLYGKYGGSLAGNTEKSCKKGNVISLSCLAIIWF